MSMSGKKVLTQVLMKGASTFTFGDEICVGILSHIPDKKLEKCNVLFWFPVKQRNANKNGKLEGPYEHCIFAILLKIKKSKVGHFS